MPSSPPRRLITLPVVIRTEQEYERLFSAAAGPMEKPEDEISEEEGRFLDCPAS